MFSVPEKYRVKIGSMRSDESYGNNGQFVVKTTKMKRVLLVQASDGEGWQHVSVSLPDRCPKWSEMALIKDLFWDDEDLVVQMHPPKSEYINNHPYCLHLWRKVDTNDFCESPHKLLVGIA